MIQQPEDSRLHEDKLSSVWRDAYDSHDLREVLQALYAQEINVGMQSFWDGGWDAWIGDEMNGKRISEHFEFDAFDEIVSWLTTAAEQTYPVLRRRRMGLEAYV